MEMGIRCKILSVRAATIGRLLRIPRRTRLTKKQLRVVPEPRRRIDMSDFAGWNEQLPDNMEMEMVAHCGKANRGSTFTARF